MILIVNIMKALLFLQTLIYNCNLIISRLLLKFKSTNLKTSENNNNEILNLTYNKKKFVFPKRNESKYNLQSFDDLRNTLAVVLNKKTPSNFIDIGAYIGIYTFIVNEIYKDLEKRINLYSFEPTKYAFELLNKNKVDDNKHALFNHGIFNENKIAYISAPSVYYSNSLKQHLKKNSKSMKSLNEKGGIDSEKIQLMKIDEILEKQVIEDSYVKIDVEGSEVEILKYLDKKNLYPQIISAELNNHYLYKRNLTIEKIFNKEIQKIYSFYIVVNENDKKKFLKKISLFELQKIIMLGNKNNFIKKYIFPKVFAIDIYLIRE